MFVVFLSLFSFLIQPFAVVEAKVIQPVKTEPLEYAAERLRAAGVSEAFIEAVKKSHLQEDRAQIVQLNVFGFLGKADYSGHFNQRALKECRKFIRKHSTILRQIEKRSGVSKEVIASLLWVETKHGAHKGRHAVGHVYLSLLQADHPEILKETFAALALRPEANLSEHKQQVIDRSIAKANWAQTELKSLERIYKKNPKMALTLTGSYAGAFGVPQFIPSSYLQWARPARPAKSSRPARSTAKSSGSGMPDLSDVNDAIQSVAFYLKSNGWKKNDPATQREALFHYNRSQGYVDVILKIARCLNAPSGSKNCSL